MAGRCRVGWKETHGLARQLAQLPLVLSGPILRRVDPNEVTVWVALKEAATVRLIVRTPSAPAPLLEGVRQTTALGPALHVVAVTAVAPAAVLRPGTIYAYDLEFTFSGGTRRLAGENVLASPGGTARVCLPGFDLPTFVLPADDPSRLRLLHTSCRRTDGKGPDATPVLARLLVDAANDPNRRPQQLIL